MYTKKQLSYILIIALLLGLFTLVGCLSAQGTIPISIQTPTKAPTIFISPSSPSSTSNPNALPTYPSTKVPPPAPSGLPPTWTALPTYPPEQSHQMVMNLYENNPCKLPCWWGITPGKTDWREAWQYLERFTINKPPWDNLLLESKEHPGYMYYQVLLDVPQTTEEAYYYFSLNYLVFMINIDTFTVDYIDVNTGNIKDYTIPEIMAAYGKPTEIYVDFGRSQVPQYNGVSLSLYYPQYGFISTHFTTVAGDEWKKTRLNACFQKATTLRLWSKGRRLDYMEGLALSSMSMTSNIHNWQPIDKVSDFSVDAFFQTYSGIQKQPCIEFITKK